MFLARYTAPALALLLALTFTPNAQAQLNNNRALMQRLDNIERDLGLMQRQFSKGSGSNFNRLTPSADGDAGPIMGNINGDLLQQVTLLEEEVRRLRGQIEENDYEISRLKDIQKRTQDENDFRLRALEGNPMPAATDNSAISNMPGTHIEVHGSNPNAYQAPKPTTAGSGNLANPGSYGNEPRKHYNEAFRLLNQNRYQDSEVAFNKFAELYPDDPLIGNAYYWLGETHYIRKNYVEAADKFREGYQKLPDGPKAPDNLLKLALSLKAMERNDDACTVLGQISKKFKDAPGSILQRTKSEQKLMGCK